MKKIYVIGAALLFSIVCTSGVLAAGEYDAKSQTMKQEKQETTLQTS